MGISAFLITYNEERKIGRTLDSLRWTDEQCVVDSDSSDHTVEICRSKGAYVSHRLFDNFAQQKNFALSLAIHEWVLSIDADEIVTSELANEIRQKVTSESPVCGYRIKRRNYFLRKPLKFAGQGNDYPLRLFRKAKGKFVGIIHETVSVDGPIGTLNGLLEHYGTETLTEYLGKLKLYTSLEAERMSTEGRTPSVPKAFILPILKWFRNYIFLGGFLDGRSGFLYHSLSCYYDWLKNVKALRTNQKEKQSTILETMNR